MENNMKKEDAVESATDSKREKAKKLSREVILYLVFGVLTTLVGWAVYFTIMACGRELFSITDTRSGAYIGLYSVAQVVQWVCAVLFAFFTNRKWVFTDADKSKKIIPQLLTFSGGRVLTFILDYVITLAGGILLSKLLPSFNNFQLFGVTWNINEISAKLVAAAVVIIGNYVFSKALVFKKKKQRE